MGVLPEPPPALRSFNVSSAGEGRWRGKALSDSPGGNGSGHGSAELTPQRRNQRVRFFSYEGEKSDGNVDDH